MIAYREIIIHHGKPGNRRAVRRYCLVWKPRDLHLARATDALAALQATIHQDESARIRLALGDEKLYNHG